MQVHIRLSLRNSLAGAAALLLFAGANVASASLYPDSIELTSGKTLRGLIVKQTSRDVTIQMPYGEDTIKNEDIVRIRNVDDDEMWFVRVLTPGSLPPWRVIANDLRNQDEIKSFKEIPATAIDNGAFKNVPYSSFRANGQLEMNIYGDPDDPAGVELGIYGIARSSEKAHKVIREFLGSYLSSIPEIKGLYALDLKKDNIQKVGNLTMEVSLPNAPDSYGAWWLSFYNEKKLNEIRLTDAEYAKLTVPVEDVLDRRGRVKVMEWEASDIRNSPRAVKARAEGRVLFDGFYRDKNGVFRLSDGGKSVAPPASQN